MCKVVILPEGADLPADCLGDIRLVTYDVGALVLTDRERGPASLAEVVQLLVENGASALLLFADAAVEALARVFNEVLSALHDGKVNWKGDVHLGRLVDGSWAVYRTVPIGFSCV